MRSLNVVVMIFVALTLCTCCCVIPACDTRRGWSERFSPPQEAEIGQPFQDAIDNALTVAPDFACVAPGPAST